MAHRAKLWICLAALAALAGCSGKDEAVPAPGAVDAKAQVDVPGGLDAAVDVSAVVDASPAADIPDAVSPDKCAGMPGLCDDSNDCTLDTCAAGGCSHAPSAGPCITQGKCGACEVGACVAGTSFKPTQLSVPVAGILPVAGGGWLAYGSSGRAWAMRVDAALTPLWEKTFPISPPGTPSWVQGPGGGFAGGAAHSDGTFTLVGDQKGDNMYGYGYVYTIAIDTAGNLLSEGKGFTLGCWATAATAYGQAVLLATRCHNVDQDPPLESEGVGYSGPGSDPSFGISSWSGVLVVVGSDVVATSGNTGIQRIQPGGAKAWSIDLGGSVTAMTLLADGAIAVTGRQGTPARQFHAVVDGTGKVLWQKPLSTVAGYPRSLCESGDLLVSADENGEAGKSQIVAVKKSDGALVWTHTMQHGGLVEVRPTGTGGFVAVGDGKLMLLNADGWAGCECTDACPAKAGTLGQCVLGACM